MRSEVRPKKGWEKLIFRKVSVELKSLNSETTLSYHAQLRICGRHGRLGFWGEGGVSIKLKEFVDFIVDKMSLEGG